MKKRLFKIPAIQFFILFILVIPVAADCQENPLKLEIERLVSKIDGITGVALLHSGTSDTLKLNDDRFYPMQSVYKFPLALAVLDQVDKGNLSLDQRIHISKSDLLPNTWSPIREKYPDGDIDLSVGDLIDYTVSQSDNNGCDVLFRLLGGTSKVNQYIRSLGIEEISIAATEEEMHSDWEVQFTNVCKPTAMLELLTSFYERKILSESSTSFLWKIMCGTTTGPGRIKGLLPEGTVVAHKTGSSGSNDQNISAAINDAGIILLPDSSYIALVVMVSNTRAPSKKGEEIIAEISRTVWDFYTTNKP